MTSRRTSRRRVVSSSTTAGSSRPRAPPRVGGRRARTPGTLRAPPRHPADWARARTRGSSASANMKPAVAAAPRLSSRTSRAAAARSARSVFIASVTDARTSSASRRTESLSSVSMPSSSGPRAVELGPAGVGDRVDGLAAVGLLRHEALLFELGQTRVDRARARDVGAAEAVAQGLDQLVAVHRPLGQEAEQVEPQVSVREDRRAHAFTVRSTLTSPPHRVDAHVGPVLVERAELAGVAALDAGDAPVVELELSADGVDRVRRRSVCLETQGDGAADGVDADLVGDAGGVEEDAAAHAVGRERVQPALGGDVAAHGVRVDLAGVVADGQLAAHGVERRGRR